MECRTTVERMSDLSSFTGKFRVHSNTSNGSTSTRVTKRTRPSLVCNQCRKNKLRCDRSQPCGSCVRRDDADACSYHPSSSANSELSRQAMAEDRLMQLEVTIKQLMQNQAAAQPQASLTPPEIPLESFESSVENAHEFSNDGNGTTRYVGSTHWSAVLDDIHELRTVLGNSADVEHPLPRETPGLDGELIFGASNAYSVEQIISQSLPPKADVDRLVATYFRGHAYVAPFIHTFQFQRKYHEFWADPPRVNPLWLAQLFCLCQMGSRVGQINGSSSSSQEDLEARQDVFHRAAGQCLVLGRYHRPQRYAPEALGLYAQCKNIRSLDCSREIGAILGMAVRIAYQMGYHRDPDALGTFTVFEGEMRRRAWSSCKQMDLMVSFQLGLPSNIRLESCDTRSPRNLFDSDFDENTQVLPPSRPESEVTPLLWYVVKDRQMVNFSKVCQNALSFKELSEPEIVRLDQEIRQVHKTLPDVLRTRPLSQSFTDPPFLIITRLYVEFIHLKSICVLHKRYMARGSELSTKCCMEAAIKLVGGFIDMYKEFSPGGQLYFEGWMLTSFTMNDFLLGTMVLCLFLHLRQRNGARDFIIESGQIKDEDVRALLMRSHAICVEKSSASKDAKRVSHAIRHTLADAEPRPVSIGMGNGNTSMASIPTSANTMSTIEQTSGPDLASLSLDLNGYSNQSNGAGFDFFDPFNFTGNESLDVDWPELDSAFFDHSL